MIVDPIANPYRPGAGRRPPVLAGRQPLLDSFEVVRQRAENYGEGDRSWILNGRRGVGKTVLLNELWTQVSGRGWISAKVEASWHVPFPVVLAKALVQAMRTATGRHPVPKLLRLLGVFQAFSLKVDPALGLVSLGADVDLVKGVADSGRLGDDLTALLQVLGETSADLGIGTLLLVDELQEATADELTAINIAVHQLGQGPMHRCRSCCVGAGLPSLPDPAGRGDPLRRAALRLPRRRPARRRPSARWRSPDRRPRCAASRGRQTRSSGARLARRLPLLPAVGRQARLGLRPARSPITLDDVEVGAVASLAESSTTASTGARWERATPRCSDQLLPGARHRGRRRACRDRRAGHGHRAASARTDLSVARDELIHKGLVSRPSAATSRSPSRACACSSCARTDPGLRGLAFPDRSVWNTAATHAYVPTLLESYAAGRWFAASDEGPPLLDASTGEEVARISSDRARPRRDDGVRARPSAARRCGR